MPNQKTVSPVYWALLCQHCRGYIAFNFTCQCGKRVCRDCRQVHPCSTKSRRAA